MKGKIVGMDGSMKESIELPEVFNTEYSPKVILRAVLAIQTAKKQPKGADVRAGKKNTATYVGTRGPPAMHRTINVGHARLPRLKNKRALLYGRVGRVPHSVGGMAAHPPKSWKVYIEKINKRERREALKSAIAATANKELVGKRFIFDCELPIIVESKFESVPKTKEVVSIFEKIGVGKDLENARAKTEKRAGRGKTRGRKLKIKKSILVVTAKNEKVLKAARNLIGVEAVTVNSLNVNLLAPGGEAGRLVVWTKNAVEELGKREKKANGKEEIKKESAEKKGETRVDARKQKRMLMKKVAAIKKKKRESRIAQEGSEQ
ncbi:MAG: 50S ribosomal protein L4 [archaeon]